MGAWGLQADEGRARGWCAIVRAKEAGNLGGQRGGRQPAGGQYQQGLPAGHLRRGTVCVRVCYVCVRARMPVCACKCVVCACTRKGKDACVRKRTGARPSH